MPRIELITPVYHNSLDPYNAEYDNLPLRYIVARQELINSAVDQNEEIIRESIGTQGTLANRLAQSIEDDGSLKTEAVDEILHNIGAHEDGEYDGVDYVRMTLEERTKLEGISEEATALTIKFTGISTTPEFVDEDLEVEDSTTITWSITAPNKVKANLAFPESAAHQHYYGLVPVHSNLGTPDYTNYKTTSGPTVFVEDSLRVYINGIRLNATEEVYVFNNDDGPSGSWELTSFTPNHTAGTFALNRAIDPTDVITIDFDISLV